MFFSRTQYGDAFGDRTQDLPMLYHYAGLPRKSPYKTHVVIYGVHTCMQRFTHCMLNVSEIFLSKFIWVFNVV